MQRTTIRYAAPAAAALVAGALLVGCTGADDPPDTSPTTGTSSTSSGTTGATSTTPRTPTTAAVVVPPEATKHTEEGAKAFARYYTQQMDEATLAADSGTLRALSAPTCKGCQVSIRIADQLKAKNQRHAALTFKLAGDRLTPNSTATTKVVDVLVVDSGSTTIDSTGNVVSKSAPANLTFRQSVEWRNDGWLLIESVLVQ